MQVLQVDKNTIKTQTNPISSKDRSEITWRDLQGLSWIFQDD